jgi:DUF1016 N-terminal domain
MNPSEAILYANIAALLQAARQTVAQTVTQTMVHTYYEIGRTIIEDEQNGASRAEYGKQTLKNLSKKLTIEFGKGFSTDNLERMKRFYLVYVDSISANPLRKFSLYWSHYLKLMRIENVEERDFYEIECATNHWSIQELQRQFDTALYERLALSRDKAGVRLLEENKTIGIVLCKDKSQALVEITLPEGNDSIFASRYQTVLPNKQTFVNLLNTHIK